MRRDLSTKSFRGLTVVTGLVVAFCVACDKRRKPEEQLIRFSDSQDWTVERVGEVSSVTQDLVVVSVTSKMVRFKEFKASCGCLEVPTQFPDLKGIGDHATIPLVFQIPDISDKTVKFRALVTDGEHDSTLHGEFTLKGNKNDKRSPPYVLDAGKEKTVQSREFSSLITFAAVEQSGAKVPYIISVQSKDPIFEPKLGSRQYVREWEGGKMYIYPIEISVKNPSIVLESVQWISMELRFSDETSLEFNVRWKPEILAKLVPNELQIGRNEKRRVRVVLQKAQNRILKIEAMELPKFIRLSEFKIFDGQTVAESQIEVGESIVDESVKIPLKIVLEGGFEFERTLDIHVEK